MLTVPRDQIAGLRALLPRVQIPLSTASLLSHCEHFLVPQPLSLQSFDVFWVLALRPTPRGVTPRHLVFLALAWAFTALPPVRAPLLTLT